MLRRSRGEGRPFSENSSCYVFWRILLEPDQNLTRGVAREIHDIIGRVPVACARRPFLRGKMSYLSKNFITGSAAMSLISILLPYSFTAGSRLTISQPIWEKKNPRVASCGSAHVSVYLWCVLWSRIHL